MNDQLMLGILLIIVGVAMGLIAAALVLNRREKQTSDEGDEIEEVGELEGDEEADSEDDDEGEQQGEELAEQEEHVDPEPEVSAEEGSPSPAAAPKSEELEQREARDRQLVAQVYREDVTGKLIVLSGDSEYSSASEITDDTERRKLAYAASDFAGWFQGEIEPRSVSAPSAPSNNQSSPDVMLEEINGILQRSISPDRGVRLFPGMDGGVKVLIGVKSYEIEEVPDEEIKELIRQAVAEWEAGR